MSEDTREASRQAQGLSDLNPGTHYFLDSWLAVWAQCHHKLHTDPKELCSFHQERSPASKCPQLRLLYFLATYHSGSPAEQTRESLDLEQDRTPKFIYT